MRLGIDFGTTRTVVACADRGNHPTVSFTNPAGDSVDWIPSIVSEQRGELRFGLDAAASGADPSSTTLRSFKRLLSGPRGGADDTVSVGQVAIPVGDLIAMFLSHVRDALLTRSNVRRSLTGRTLKAAIAVPANAYSGQRLLTIDGFRRAGFAVTRMLNEPSAAGFEYTHRHRDTLSSQRDLVVVYDLGGGTFDASVVRMTGPVHDVLATAGVAELGGDDFDVALAEVTLRRVGLTLSELPGHASARLVDQCRSAKEALNPNSRKITIDLDAALGDRAPTLEVTIPASDFYDACRPLVERSIEAMVPIMSRLDDATGPDLAEVAGVYVVGGASELPIVARALRERFGRRVHRSPYPSAAVAIGLSIAADEATTYDLVDRYSRTFGVFREGNDGRKITFDPIFARDTPVPSPSEGPLTFTREYRAAHNVGHFRFLECSSLDERGEPRGDTAVRGDVRFPFAPELAGEANLAQVAVERRPGEGPRILERYSLDESGIVDVLIRNVDSGYERVFHLAGGEP